MAQKRKRFESLSKEEIEAKRLSAIPVSTCKNNIKWDKVFREYLAEKGCQSTEYWYYPDTELDDILCHFWFEVRMQKSPLSATEKEEARNNKSDLYPERYTITSLRNLRNGLT